MGEVRTSESNPCTEHSTLGLRTNNEENKAIARERGKTVRLLSAGGEYVSLERASNDEKVLNKIKAPITKKTSSCIKYLLQGPCNFASKLKPPLHGVEQSQKAQGGNMSQILRELVS